MWVLQCGGHFGLPGHNKVGLSRMRNGPNIELVMRCTLHTSTTTTRTTYSSSSSSTLLYTYIAVRALKRGKNCNLSGETMMHCLSQRLKSIVFLKNILIGGRRCPKRWEGDVVWTNKNQKYVNFSLWGNCKYNHPKSHFRHF